MPISKQQWAATPYAGTQAQDPERDVHRLLEKYRVTERQWTHCRGANGRPLVALVFNLRGKAYRVAFEVLDCPAVDVAQRERQIVRVIYWTLKTALEAANIFLPTEKALMPYLILPDGSTMWEAAEPHMARLTVQNFSGQVLRPQLTDQRVQQSM